jgi:hypothetical protein
MDSLDYVDGLIEVDMEKLYIDTSRRDVVAEERERYIHIYIYMYACVCI